MKKILLSIVLIISTGISAQPTFFSEGLSDTNSSASELSSGSLATSFDRGDGKISSDIGGSGVVIKDVVISNNRKNMYLCGSSGSTAVMSVIKYRYNDTSLKWELDTTWGTSGVVTPDVFDSATTSVANAMALQNGFIYLAGQGTVSSSAGMVVVKIKESDGSVVTDFDTDGVALLFGGGSGEAHGIALSGDYVIAVGTDDSGADLAIAKLNKTTGAVDAAFDGDSATSGSNGALTLDISGTEVAHDVKVHDGFIYVVGKGADNFLVVKMDLATGKLATVANGFTAFDTDGYINGVDAGHAKAVAHDGTYLYVAGHNAAGTDAKVIAYAMSDGAKKSTFGTSGVFSSSSAIDTFEDIKLAGNRLFLTGKNGSNGAIAELTSNGAFNTGFSSDGYDITSASNIADGATALAFVDPQTIVIVGADTSNNEVEMAAFGVNVDPINTAAQVAALQEAELAKYLEILRELAPYSNLNEIVISSGGIID